MGMAKVTRSFMGEPWVISKFAAFFAFIIITSIPLCSYIETKQRAQQLIFLLPALCVALCLLQLFLIILQGIQIVIPALLVQQLLMRALLQNFPMGEENNIVGMLDGG